MAPAIGAVTRAAERAEELIGAEVVRDPHGHIADRRLVKPLGATGSRPHGAIAIRGAGAGAPTRAAPDQSRRRDRLAVKA